MPKRMNVNRIPSEAVQGEDSYVDVRRMTVDEFDIHNRRMVAINKARAENDQEALNKFEVETRQFYADVLMDWNWVDDNGDPLPKPHKNVEVISALTVGELEWLTGVIMLGGGEKKASIASTTK